MNLGVGFADSISKTPKKSRVFDRRNDNVYMFGNFLTRHILIYIVLVAVFSLLLFQIMRLQLIDGPYYYSLSEQNRIKTKVIHAPRGNIYDRAGIPLVHNVPGFREKRSECENLNECIKIVSRDEVLRRKAKGEDLSRLEVDSLRQYVNPAVFAHVVGYISQITKEELEDLAFKAGGYTSGDQIGRGGVEEAYEEILRGKAGKELIEADAHGEELRILGKLDPIAGGDVTLTIDSKLQEVAFNAMKGKTGAVIATNPKTGEILTLLSTPSFDSNLFTMGENYQPQEYQEEEYAYGEDELIYKSASQILADEKNRPLFNRAISGTYPPGSTFKIVTAAAALEEGVVDKDTQIEDTGVLRIGSFSFANWYFTQYGKTEGSLDIVAALKRSNDIFFYKTAELTGIEKLAEFGGKFGLGKSIGIDLPHEEGGLFPSDSWKREQIGEGWYIGDTYHVGIGQGFLLTTPLQVNVWTNVIADNGRLCQPTVLKKEMCTIRNQGFLRQETIDLIKEGMRQACDTGGTGWPLFKFKIQSANLADKIDERNFFAPPESTVSGQTNNWVHIPVACKTGTAEFGDPKNRTHAWFTAYAPIDDPQISVTVLVEGGGEGSSVAGPIAKKIFEEWFTR